MSQVIESLKPVTDSLRENELKEVVDISLRYIILKIVMLQFIFRTCDQDLNRCCIFNKWLKARYKSN